MKRFTALLTGLALIAGTVGCPAAPPADPGPTPPVRYDLTVSSTEGGAVIAPGEGVFTYEPGTVVELVAEAEEGYRFESWTDDVVTIGNSNAAQTTITMNGDYAVTASFIAVFDLTISSTEGGAVINPGEGTFNYDEGAAVSLVAAPEAGYRFLRWSGDIKAIADSTSTETYITMDANYSIRASFAPLYGTSDALLQGLLTPVIYDRDDQGRIYFTEFDTLSKQCRISRFDPSTGEAVHLIEHVDSRILLLALDGQGGLYYVLAHEPPIAQVRRLLPGEAESTVLASIEETGQWIIGLTADKLGNVYFALQSGARGQLSPGSELRRIPAGTTTIETILVLEDSSRICSLIVTDDPDTLYFTSTGQEASRIYKLNLESEVLATILERTTEDFGAIAYLATRADGELYYLYRQRSGLADPAQFGYLEIGRFTLEALETSQPPEILVTDELDRAVWAWVATFLSFFRVSDNGDVFFSVILHKEGLAAQAPIGIFWFNPQTEAYSCLVAATPEEIHSFTFVLDDEGNVYYSATTAGTLVRINR